MADLFAEYGQLHGILMTIAWFFLQNILLWSQYFKHLKFSIYVHMGCAILIALLHTAGALMMGIAVQFQIKGWHKTPGFLVLLLLIFILGSGSLCWHNKVSPNIPPSIVYITNKAHPIFGWLILIAAKISLYKASPYKTILLIIDIISHVSYLILKFIPKSAPTSIKGFGMRTIKSHKDLKIYGTNYFIYADVVFSTDQLIMSHPGGFKIINQIRGRYVDRFIHGVQPLQKFHSIGPVNHSINSIKLAGQSLGRIQSPITYRNMQQQNLVQIASLSKMHQISDVYIVYLKSCQKYELEDLGYESLKQVGQYYSLKQGNITRLYTAVNFLQKHNKQVMRKINELMQSEHIDLIDREQQKQSSIQARNRLPLLIKKYQKGKFTSKNINPNNDRKMVLSRNRGFGLSLQQKNAGKIVIIAGGTGLHPFCDLIDLLFKDMLIQKYDAKIFNKKQNISAAIKAYDPLLNVHPFQSYNFAFYFAIDQIEDVHPITLFQCNKLAQNHRHQCTLRVKEPLQHDFKDKYKNISLMQDKFEEVLKQSAQNRSVSHIYICGPTRMTSNFISLLQYYEINPQKYTII